MISPRALVRDFYGMTQAYLIMFDHSPLSYCGKRYAVTFSEDAATGRRYTLKISRQKG